MMILLLDGNEDIPSMIEGESGFLPLTGASIVGKLFLGSGLSLVGLGVIVGNRRRKNDKVDGLE